jgi:hypothetical protein
LPKSKQPKIAIVGNPVYFANHYPENWRRDSNTVVFEATENDYSFLIAVANFRPDLTIFFRPELYPQELITAISGVRIAFLSEPLPLLKNKLLHNSSETLTRIAMYSRMAWQAFHRVYYYDAGKRATLEALGWRIDGYLPLPIDTSLFRPDSRKRPIDLCFVGKPTERRVRLLDALRYMNFRFLWIAHGVSGKDLALIFRRSKIVLNLHADDLPALEPRVFLGAASGCVVLTEDPGYLPEDVREHVVTFQKALYGHVIEHALSVYEESKDRWKKAGPLLQYSMRRFILDELAGR